MNVCLASTSPRRRALLKGAGVRFRILAPRYHESVRRGERPVAAVLRHALAKALSVRRRVQDGVIIGSDTLVHFRGRIIGKPRDRRHAFALLSALQGKTHDVYTGLALVTVRGGAVSGVEIFHERSRVRLKPLDRSAIERYFKRVDPLDKAGAYAAQQRGDTIVSGVKGSFSNVVGLPVERLCAKLKKL